MQAPHLATRTQTDINLGNPRHESLGRLDGQWIDDRHLQGHQQRLQPDSIRNIAGADNRVNQDERNDYLENGATQNPTP